MGQHDLSYRALFSFPRMVRELVCEFVDEPWVEKLDFTTLQRVNASHVSADQLKSREGDLLWKLRLRDGTPVYVFLLIEHQSRAVLTWFSYVLLPRHGEGEPIPEALGLEEFKVMLEKRVEEWNHEILEKGIKKGRQEGRQEGEAIFLLRLLERKFGRLDLQTRERVQGADAERLLDWGERVLTAERLEDVFEN